jgi:phage baseplate assembly protein W
MRYRIVTANPQALSLSYESRLDELVGNCRILLSCAQGSVPGYRHFGMDMGYLGLPTSAAKSAFAGAIADALEKFIPDCTVRQVTFEDDAATPDQLKPIIEVSYNE